MIILDQYGNPYPEDAFPPPPDLYDPVTGFVRIFGKGDLEGFTFDIKEWESEMGNVTSVPFQWSDITMCQISPEFHDGPQPGDTVTFTLRKENYNDGTGS